MTDLYACPCGYWHPTEDSSVCTPAGLAPDRTISCLTASSVRRFTTAAQASVADAAAPADPASRVVSGLLVPYGGEVGYTSAGPVTMNAGALQLPGADALGRVKLMDYHQTPPVAVGYLTALRDTPTGLRGSFYVAATPDGDRALLEVRERVRDGFSVELLDVTINDRGEVTSAGLSAVALVPIPAWASAREDGLAASLTETEGTNMNLTPEQLARLNELLAIDAATRSDADSTELAELLATASEGVTPEAPAEPPAAPAAPAAPAQAGLQAGLQRPAAQVPGSIPSGARRQRPAGRAITELYAAQARVLSGTSRPDLEAALSDVTSTANIWVAGTAYDGELWSGLEYVRRWVPLMSPGELTSYKGTGWRWGTKPEVDDYAGDKAPVPSNAPTTVAADWVAARLAGAHDLDRKFVDFGDAEFIASYYQAMRESYARKSDVKARAFLLASATAPVAAGTGMFRAAAVAAQQLDTNTDGMVPDYFLINANDRLALLDITQDDIPAYLETFGVTPDKFISTPGQTAGKVTAGVRAGTKFRELAGSPIRVEAINIANGGVDGGVFGYYATQLLETGAVTSATFV